MSWDVSNKIIWLAVIGSAVCAYSYVPSVLHQIRNLAVVPEPSGDKANPQLQQDAEDAIKLSTIRRLADGPSHELRSSAIKIVTDRFFKTGAKRRLFLDISSKSWHRRDKAINALWLLVYNPALSEKNVTQRLLTESTFNAIVAALVVCLPSHERSTSKPRLPTSERPIPPSPIRPEYRSAHEKSLMHILIHLLQEPQQMEGAGKFVISSQLAINAGIVRKWLAHYPFPCTLPENSHFNFKRSDVCSLFDWKAWGRDDLSMSTIFQLIMRFPEGVKQLEEVGLRASNYSNRLNENSDASWNRFLNQSSSSWSRMDHDEDVRMVNGESTAGATLGGLWRPIIPEGENVTLRPGSTERSPEEESLRRRHREAVVVAEAGVPLRRENILQRRPTETTDTFEQMIQAQQDAILSHREEGTQFDI